MVYIIIGICITFLVSGVIFAGIVFWIFLIPKLNECIDNHACIKYIPSISGSARSLGGSNIYSESELKFITEAEVYLTVEVSVKMKGAYKRDDEVSFYIMSLNDGLTLEPISNW